MGNNSEHIPVRTVAELGNLIRQRRKATKITIRTMAKLMGVSPRFLGELERGRATVASGTLLEVLSTLGIDIFAKPRS